MSKISHFVLFLPLLSLIFPSSILAQGDWNNGRCTVNINTPKGTINDVATIQGLECVFANILQVITYFAGLVFLFMLISGGFNYMSSSNDPKKVAAASTALTNAFIGFAGVVISWLILSFIANFTGIPNITRFEIPYITR